MVVAVKTKPDNRRLSSSGERTMRIFLSCALVALLSSSLATNLIGANPTTPVEPENTIKEVMKKAHKEGHHKKVVGGEASAEEKATLLGLYIDMFEGTPKKGERGEWMMAAGPAVLAAGKVVAGREGAIEELKTAMDCKACHDKFK